MCPPRFGRRAAARHRLAIGVMGKFETCPCPPMPSSLFRSAGRSPRRPPLPPLLGVKRLVMVKRMVDVDTETRSSVGGIETRYVYRCSLGVYRCDKSPLIRKDDFRPTTDDPRYEPRHRQTNYD